MRSAPRTRPIPAPITSMVEEPVLRLLKDHGTRQYYQPGQIIFYQGHKPLGVYVHESGRIAFLKGKREMRHCCDPCIVGMQALVTDQALPYSARATEAVSVVFLGRSALDLLRQTHPGVFQDIERNAQ